MEMAVSVTELPERSVMANWEPLVLVAVRPLETPETTEERIAGRQRE